MSQYDQLVFLDEEFERSEVRQFEYRTARIIHPLFELERDEEIEDILSKMSGKQRDNHTVYEIQYPTGYSVAISFDDSKMIIGVGVEKINH